MLSGCLLFSEDQNDFMHILSEWSFDDMLEYRIQIDLLKYTSLFFCMFLRLFPMIKGVLSTYFWFQFLQPVSLMCYDLRQPLSDICAWQETQLVSNTGLG